jgi:hypothetical protein
MNIPGLPWLRRPYSGVSENANTAFLVRLKAITKWRKQRKVGSPQITDEACRRQFRRNCETRQVRPAPTRSARLRRPPRQPPSHAPAPEPCAGAGWISVRPQAAPHAPPSALRGTVQPALPGRPAMACLACLTGFGSCPVIAAPTVSGQADCSPRPQSARNRRYRNPGDRKTLRLEHGPSEHGPPEQDVFCLKRDRRRRVCLRITHEECLSRCASGASARLLGDDALFAPSESFKRVWA